MKKNAFTDLFWYRPTSSRHDDHHDIPTNGPPQVILNGPYPDICELAPTLASFDFIPGRHNWGVRNIPPELLKVDWPVKNVHVFGQYKFAISNALHVDIKLPSEDL